MIFSAPASAFIPSYERHEPISGSINAPSSVAVDSSENLYVADIVKGKVIIYNRYGRYREITGIDRPISIAVRNNRTFIGSKGAGCVAVYDSSLGNILKLGKGNGEFTHPNAIAVDRDGNAYVSDARIDRIKVYRPDGSFSFSFGGPGGGDGQFHFPTAIAVNDITGEVIVSDLRMLGSSSGAYEGARIQVFDMKGTFIRSFGVFGIGEGKMIRPMGLAVDKENRIYVSDSFQNVIQVFESDGSYAGTIFNIDRPMRTPLGIAMSKGNRLYVASLNTGTVEVYHIGLPSAHITVSPGTYAFGDTEPGTSAGMTFTVSNTGAEDLIIGNITSPSAPFRKTLDGCEHMVLGPSESCSIDVEFAPLENGFYEGVFYISSNDPDEGFLRISLTGSGAVSTSSPVASAGGPYKAEEGRAVILDGSGSADPDGLISRYEWDVDNNGVYEYSTSQPAVTHVYTANGTYEIRLRVTDNSGAAGEAVTTADISDSVPVADFTAAPVFGVAPLAVEFMNSSSGYDQPLRYEWDLDNNGTVDSDIRDPFHVYNDPGTYSVKLTVTDADGSSSALIRTGYIKAAVAVYALSMTNNGNGRVTGDPAGNECGRGCIEYEKGTIVALTPIPEEGWKFSHWNGACTGTGECQVTMNADMSVQASFTRLLLHEDFNWDQRSGEWNIEKNGKDGTIEYSVKGREINAPAISLYGLQTQDMIIGVKAKEVGTGGYRNFFIVFAYDEAAGKAYMAGARAGTGYWSIEEADLSTGSVRVLSKAAGTVLTGTWYFLRLVIDGDTVALSSNGSEKVRHNFPSGVPHGEIGLGGIYNHAHFDDFSVFLNENGYTYSEDFNWDQISGIWKIEKDKATGEMEYGEQSSPANVPAITLFDVLTQDMSMEAEARDSGEGSFRNFFMVFAYDEWNGKAYWAGARSGANRWTIEEVAVKTGAVRTLASFAEPMNKNIRHHLKVVITGNTVVLFGNDAEKTRYTFPGSMPHGRTGIGGVNNRAFFDNVKADN